MSEPMPHRRDLHRCVTFAILALVTASTAHAADTIGEATEVARRASAQAGGSMRDLAIGSPVAARDTIVTDASGRAALRLVDNTQVSVGPGSSVRLDSFVFNSSSSASSVVVRASRGVFRFVTGQSSHDAYRVVTPSATIGVRGTAFSVAIGGATTRVSVEQGVVIVCPIRNRSGCVEGSAGQTIVVTPTGTTGGSGGAPQRRGDTGGTRRRPANDEPIGGDDFGQIGTGPFGGGGAPIGGGGGMGR